MQSQFLSNRPHPRYMTGLGFFPNISDSDTLNTVYNTWVNFFTNLCKSNPNEKFSTIMETFVFASIKSSYGANNLDYVLNLSKTEFQNLAQSVCTSDRVYKFAPDDEKAIAYAHAFLRASSSVRSADPSNSYYLEINNTLASQTAENLYAYYDILCTVDHRTPQTLRSLISTASETSSNIPTDISLFDKIKEIKKDVFSTWYRESLASDFSMRKFLNDHIYKYIQDKAGAMVLANILNSQVLFDQGGQKYNSLLHLFPNTTDPAETKKVSWTSLDTFKKYFLVFVILGDFITKIKDEKALEDGAEHDRNFLYFKQLSDLLEMKGVSQTATIQDLLDQMCNVRKDTKIPISNQDQEIIDDAENEIDDDNDEIDDELDQMASSSMDKQKSGINKANNQTTSKSDNSLLYVGIASGLAAIGTALIIMKSRKKKKPRNR